MFNNFMSLAKSNKAVQCALYFLSIIVLLSVLSVFFKVTNLSEFFGLVENKSFDARQKMLLNFKADKANKDIVIVTIDDASYEYLSNKYGEWPLPRNVYADVINYLEKQNPNSIAFDLMFVSSFKSKANADAQLVSAMSSYNNILTGMNFDDMSYDVRQPINLPARLQLTVDNKSNVDFSSITFSNCRAILPEIINSNIKIGILNVVRSADGIIREFPAIVKYQSGFYPNLAFLTSVNYQSKLDKENYNSIAIDKNNNLLAAGKKLPLNTDGGMILNWYGPSNGKTFKHVPLYHLVKLMNGETLQDADANYDFTNKIVFIGTTATSMADVKSTPITSAGETYPGVEIYATFVNNFIDNNFIKKVSDNVNILVSMFLALLVGFIVMKSKSTYVALGLSVAALFVYVISSYCAMGFGNLWLDIVMPVIFMTVVFIYGFLVKYLIKSRDFDYQYKLATTDGLTELYNHRYFQDQMRMQIDGCKRYGSHFSLIIVDIDFFKKFNDTYGHQAGDAVLKQVAATLKRNVRATDIVCRYGGEEMSIILTNTDKEEAIFNAKRICAAVSEKPFKLNATQTSHVTISLGVSTFPQDGETPQELIQISDDGLYYAKEHGRNQVGISGVPVGEEQPAETETQN